MFLILGYLCNAEGEETTDFSPLKELDTPSPPSALPPWDDYAPGLFFRLLLPSNRESDLPSGVHI